MVPEKSILLIRFEDKTVLSLNFGGFFEFLFSCPMSEDADWSDKINKESGNSNTKTPNEMFILPALDSYIINEIIMWISLSTIIFTTII